MEKYGIDISEFQGNVDFKKVKADGKSFVIVRAGYGNLVSQKDQCFDVNAQGAIANGLKLGAYWFSYAINEADARKEADVCAAVLAPYKEKITLPVFFDYEYASYSYAVKMGVTPGKSLILSMTIAFIERMKAHGYDAGYYTNYDFMSKYYDDPKMAPYKLWIAHYGSSAPKYACVIQQTASDGKVSGIYGNVDLDKMIETAEPPKESQSEQTYTYKKITWGEVLEPIAKNCGATVSALLTLNRAKKDDVALTVKLPRKTVDEIAHEIIRGEGGWGNFPFRSIRLRKAGYDPGAVQDRVDQLMGAK